MESRKSFITTIIMMGIVVTALAIIILMSDNPIKHLLAGLLLFGCSFFFVMIYILRHAGNHRHKKGHYDMD